MSRPTKVTFMVEVEVGNDLVMVDVDGDFCPGSPGYTYGPPESCYPSEGPEFDITRITLDGVEVDENSIQGFPEWEDLIELAEAEYQSFR